MNQQNLNRALSKHSDWVVHHGGAPINFYKNDLRWLSLLGANIKSATFDKCQMRFLDLRNCRALSANFSNSDMRNSNMVGGDFRFCNFHNTDLRDADLRYARLEEAVWPLSCKTASKGIKVDKKIKAQLLYHAFIVECAEFNDADENMALKDIKKFISSNFNKYGGEGDELREDFL